MMTPDCYRLSARYAASGRQTATVAWRHTSIVRWRNKTGGLTTNAFTGSCRRITCCWQNLAIESQSTVIPATSWHSSRIRTGVEIRCLNREVVRVVFSLDCCDREAICWSATTGGINSVMVQDLLTESVEKRFGNTLYLPHAVEWLTDNGCCYIADSIRTFATSLRFIVCTTPVRSPESNGMAESFVKTFKRDYVYVNDLPDAMTVMWKLTEWMEDYNNWHPHKGLKMQSPREYRSSLLAIN